ncbi:MAG: putative DNA binding domain-containing protein, partial [Bacteroides sp.]|nr:putative DNA binding domain-containing protein [Bacteroides sp.]
MTESELQQYLQCKYPQENESCEWKEFKNIKNSFCGDEKNDVISYVSAIANMDGGHLVIGVRDKTLEIVGIDIYNYDRQKAILRLTERCINLSTEGLEIEEFITEGSEKRVWVFHIPKHRPKLPVYAHNKAWQRIEDSLVELTRERLNAILEENSPTFDWSAEIIESATMEDLDEKALAKARSEYKTVHPRLVDEVDNWDNMEFLSRAGVANRGHLTRAAILLLGKPTAIHLLSPSVATITWVLVDEYKEKKDYEHFSIPFLLTVDEALAKIRNLNQRILPGGTLFPDIVKQYDEYSIREILHNCIAHQDYTLQERITMVETPDSVTFSNGGFFLPGSVRNAIEQNGPQKFYRNYVLCQGMVNFNMIDTIGRGIRKVFTEQKKRFFPMPDYHIDQVKKEVTVKIYGKLINEKYYRLLKANQNLELEDCIALDFVQKHEPIDKDMATKLRRLHLIEGRYPKLFLSEYVAKTSDNKELKTEYIKNRSFNDSHFKDMILSYLRSFGGATRAELNTLLQSKLSDVLSDEQKIRKIGNLLSSMKKDGLIRISEKKKWILVEV